MLTLRSPAKLNLFLQIVNRREDGYHNLASLFQTIELHDTVHFALSKEDHLTCSVEDIPTDSSNLIFKAADLFRKKTGLRFGLNVRLEKNIPSQAGLGGGSSNAATTLWALNTLLDHPVEISELAAWSSEVGSDVPFFFSQGTAFCTGRGEKVQILDPLPPCTLWIVKPNEGLSTPDVYRRVDLKNLSACNLLQLANQFGAGYSTYFNDLEKAAFLVLPELKALKASLIECGFDTVLMTGSGSAFFCIGDGTPTLNLPFIQKTQFINRKADSWY